MACYHPLFGWRARALNPNGKRNVVFNVALGYKDFPVTVPCGKCDGCRLEYARQWAVRCMHEASLQLENCFITLTYDDAHLPAGSGLDRRAFPLFMKRLRKDLHGRRVRYFHCGEYGDKSGRPHYHALLFGLDFYDDRRQWAVRAGFPVWRSDRLERLWPFGSSEIGSLTYESACYVARYVTKKQVGASAWRKYADVDVVTGEVHERAREYTTMSRRPGVGMGWLQSFVSEVYPADSVAVRGRLCKPPRAYDKFVEASDAEVFARVRRGRQERIDELENTPERLAAREACAIARVNLARGL